MLENLELTPRVTTMGCGIYEAGDTERCYTLLFITNRGYVLPINHRAISSDDLMNVYKQGLLDGADEMSKQDDQED